MIDTGLEGRVVIVTGANRPSGIGAATALAFAAQGADVFITYWRTPVEDNADLSEAGMPGSAMLSYEAAQDASDVLEAIREMGGRAAMMEVDLADVAAVSRIFDEAEGALGPVDVLVNNAAYWAGDTLIPASESLVNTLPEQWSSVSPLTSETFDPHFAVNARATALMMMAFTRRLLRDGRDWGRIINLSTDGAHCFPSEVSYGASKLALEGLSRSAAVEYGQFGITVNVLSPGPIQTGWITPEVEKTLVPGIPLERVGEPADVADVIVFLASEQARWITGQVIHVGGGHHV